MANRAETQVVYAEHFDAIARAFEGGAEETDLASEYDVSPTTIGRWLMKAGYKHRGRGRYPLAIKERAAELRSQGWDFDAISNLLKVDREYVDEWTVGIPKGTPSRAKRNPRKPSKKDARISAEAQELIDNPAWSRHKRGRLWTDEQKQNVLDLMRRGFTPLEVWRIAGASIARQRSIWRATGSNRPAPNIRAREKRRREEREELEEAAEAREARRRRRRAAEEPKPREVAPGGRREKPAAARKPKPLPPEGRPEPYEPGDVPRPRRRRRALPESEE